MNIVVLKSGSKGNSTLIKTNKFNLLIDAGITLKELQNYDENITIDYILVTHSHSDHTSGLKRLSKVFNPLIYSRNEEVLNDSNFNCQYLNDSITIDNLNITSFNLSHDSDCTGFLIKDLDTLNELVYITDTGYINKKILNLIKNKNTYIIESNHDTNMLMDGPYPYYLKQRILSDTGHLSNKDCSRYLKDLIGSNTKNIVLAHLSEKNNDEDTAYKTLTETLAKNNLHVENIYIAKQKINLDKIEV